MLPCLAISVVLNVWLLYRGLQWMDHAEDAKTRLVRLRAQTIDRAPYDTPFDHADDYQQRLRVQTQNALLQKTPFKHWC